MARRGYPTPRKQERRLPAVAGPISRICSRAFWPGPSRPLRHRSWRQPIRLTQSCRSHRANTADSPSSCRPRPRVPRASRAPRTKLVLRWLVVPDCKGLGRIELAVRMPMPKVVLTLLYDTATILNHGTPTPSNSKPTQISLSPASEPTNCCARYFTDRAIHFTDDDTRLFAANDRFPTIAVIHR